MLTKAQIISSDFIVASVLFLILIGVFYSLWINKFYLIDEERRISNMADAALLASNIWLQDGNPKYWNQTNIVELGLANENRLNQTKINMLNDLDYKKVKDLVGLNDYEFLLRIYDKNNETLFIFGKFEQPKSVSKIKRASILNGKIVFIDTIVWSK